MPNASWGVGNFLGGEISQFAQGRFDKPDYRNSLKVCLNSFPSEIGTWVRRPGTQHAGIIRAGAAARVVKFDFEASAPVTMEFTEGFLRFRNGAALITTNDAQSVVVISAANPAVVQVANAVTWSSGDTAILPGASTPLLENRQFKLTKIDTTHFSIADAISGANIDGSTLGALAGGATIARLHEVATVYTGGSWETIRAVQAETTDILLTASVAPQALTVTLPSATATNPTFALSPVTFTDGPYLDPFTNGVRVTPGAVSGIVTMTLSFPTYSSSVAYTNGAFVVSSGTNYQSLQDQNINNTPASSPTFWQAVSLGAGINNGRGILGSDVGRLARFFNEPTLWASGTAYNQGALVSYNPSGVPGATTYWQSLAGSNTGNVPGTDATHWSLVTTSGSALWTWGKITGLGTAISGSTGSNIGNMTAGGGLAGAFSGTLLQSSSASAEVIASGGPVTFDTTLQLIGYVGKNYTGAGGKAIDHAIVYPSTDISYGAGSYSWHDGLGHPHLAPFDFQTTTFTINLRANNSLPASSSDGTLLGTTGVITNTSAPFTIASNSASTFNYVWIELVAQFKNLSETNGVGYTTDSYSFFSSISQVVFFSPPGTGTGESFNVEILGPTLLYTNLITVWRLGVYSNTTGWPTCGVYNDGRLYLGGAVGNRFDACVSNGIVGGTINFAPTDQYGVVSAASAISYTFNSNGVNPILWMDPDLQGIKMGTQAGEWLVQAPTAGPIAPTNISARNVTNHGSANIQPCRTEHTTVFVQRFAQKLLEYFPDVFSGKFSAPNIADKAQHITRSGVAELAYTSAVTPIIWGRDALGALFGVTYKRDSLASSQPPTFYGWHRHALGSGRIVESLCSGPSVGGNLDALTMVTNDTTNIRHVEVLTDTPDELSALASAWFLDDAVNPTSTSTTNAASGGAPYGGLTINGLWHLNGNTVQVFAGGLDCGDPGDNKTTFTDFVVSNGSIFVPYGDGISVGSGKGLFTATFAAGLSLSQIVVGFTYNSDGQLVRPMTPADSGARNGPAFAKLSRGHRFGLKLANTLGLLVGGDLTKKLFPAAFKKADGVTNIAALTTFSGIHQDSLQDDYGYEGGSPAWRVSRPFPANVIIVGSNLGTQDQ